MSLPELVLIVFYVIILMYSIIIHEVAHGVAALWLGDPTAKYAGRLTANPIKHIDLWWTILIPIFILISTGGRFAFGGAKPVPYNPYNLKNQKWGPVMVALAGPASNVLIALIFAVAAKIISIPSMIKVDIIKSLVSQDWSGLSIIIHNSIGSIFFVMFSMIVFWNVLLAFFNLIPIPPLDGSKLLYPVLNLKVRTMFVLEQFGLLFLLIFILLFGGLLGLLLNFFWNIFFSLTV